MRTVFKLLILLVVLGSTFLFNVALVDIRLEEIRYLLGNIAVQQDVSNTFGIVARYELIRKRMDHGEDNIDAFELEARIQALTSGDRISSEPSAMTDALFIPVRAVLNTIRFLLGKEILSPQEDDKIFNIIEIAYFWERNRRYLEAIKIYSEVLENVLAPETRASIMVHKAFCYSMLNDYEKSKELYERVISQFPGTEAGIVSWRLLDFIQNMEKQRHKLEAQNLTELERAKQHFLLMDFRSSIRNISYFLEKKPPLNAEMEARYYKARSHEELGETEEAMLEYQRIIREDKSRNWAKQANRRLLMLGEFYEQQQQVAQEARRQLEAYQDQAFMRNVERYSGMVAQSSLRAELSKQTQPQGQSLTNDSLLDIISMLGKLDLTGENEAKNQTQKSAQREIANQASKLSPPELQELQRRRDLAANPYRRPGFIRNTIDEYSPELRFIYNRHLRSGERLSGRMLVELTIDADGSVSAARTMQSTIGSSGFEKQIEERIRNWRFRSVPDSLGTLVVNYPFEFFEGE